MASSPAMRVAVVGHVEWCEFAEVPHVPAPSEIVHAAETFEEPAGGGAVAAVQLKKLAGSATLFTAFGDDELGHRLGPCGADRLDWRVLDSTDAVYVTAGDVEAVRQARRARTLVATPRGLETLADAHVELDALVASGRDPGELYRPGDLDPAPRVVVRTAGAAGGEWETVSGERGRWGPAPLPGRVRDSYGCGDSFAAGLTYALGAGWKIEQAVELAARCGAACLTGRGPYEAQLTL